MNTAPQVVTERYVTNLINYGRNREFDIMHVTQHDNMIGDEKVGIYYNVMVWCQTAKEHNDQRANGATISQAVRRALEKHGVTFR